MTWLILPVLTIVLAWVAGVMILTTRQRRLLYRPMTTAPDDPRLIHTEWMRPIRNLDSLLGWWSPPSEDRAFVLVYFHGNRGTLPRVADKIASWRSPMLGLFAATYRGYEGNPGHPNENGLYADARQALDWLADQGIPSERIIVYGESLGTGIAVQMACERPVRAVVLEAPFASIPAVAAARYPWTPARFLVKDRFDNLSKIGGLTMPILILHGTADRTIGVDHARRLASAQPAVRLALIPGAGHLDLYEHGAQSILKDFINTLHTT